MELTKKINEIYGAVSESKFGPIFFDIKDGEIVSAQGFVEGKKVSLEKSIGNYRLNQQAFEVFKICLVSVLGMRMEANGEKEDFEGDQWKKGDA